MLRLASYVYMAAASPGLHSGPPEPSRPAPKPLATPRLPPAAGSTAPSRTGTRAPQTVHLAHQALAPVSSLVVIAASQQCWECPCQGTRGEGTLSPLAKILGARHQGDLKPL